MAVNRSKFQELAIPNLPQGLLRIPDKSKLRKRYLSFVIHRGSLPHHFQFVLMTLTLDPLRQRWILAVEGWNRTVSVFFFELYEAMEVLLPYIGLECSESDRAKRIVFERSICGGITVGENGWYFQFCLWVW